MSLPPSQTVSPSGPVLTCHRAILSLGCLTATVTNLPGADRGDDHEALDRTVVLAQVLRSTGGDEPRPLEVTCNQLEEAAEAQGLIIEVHRFTELLPGQSLPDHARAMQACGAPNDGGPVGPWLEGSLRYVSSAVAKLHGIEDLAVMRQTMHLYWKGAVSQADGKGSSTPLHQHQEWNAHLKNLLSGRSSEGSMIQVAHPRGWLILLGGE